MDWKSLPAFLAVARSGSLRAAAAQMGGTHATLRRQVEALKAVVDRERPALSA